MLVSKAAQVQVWPLVERWLRDPLVPVHASTVMVEPVPAKGPKQAKHN